MGRPGMGLWMIGVVILMSCGGLEAYKNYTVGDSAGWYDNVKKPNVDYTKWAAGKNFSLGDFLIFNTDTNHTVVQTYNATTYKNCDYEDADTDDTIEWSAAAPSTEANPVTVAVPLVREGINYFFSGDYDGEQCAKGGQKFEISVAHGQGLPPALKVPPAAPTGDDDDPESSPVTTNTPSSFNNPVTDSTPDSQANSDTSSAPKFMPFNAFLPFVFICLSFVILLF